MPLYVALIYEREADYAEGVQETYDKVMQAHVDFAAKHGSKLRGGHALQPTATATSIRKNGTGGLSTTDGPFAETKEALGGFYIIEADDLDEAMAIAGDVPALFGGVELRPVMVFD